MTDCKMETYRQTLDMRETGFHLRKIREERGRTVAMVAGHLGTSQQAIYNWEIGKTEISIRHLIALCSYYGIGLDDAVRQKAEECICYEE